LTAFAFWTHLFDYELAHTHACMVALLTHIQLLVLKTHIKYSGCSVSLVASLLWKTFLLHGLDLHVCYIAYWNCIQTKQSMPIFPNKINKQMHWSKLTSSSSQGCPPFEESSLVHTAGRGRIFTCYFKSNLLHSFT